MAESWEIPPKKLETLLNCSKWKARVFVGECARAEPLGLVLLSVTASSDRASRFLFRINDTQALMSLSSQFWPSSEELVELGGLVVSPSLRLESEVLGVGSFLSTSIADSGMLPMMLSTSLSELSKRVRSTTGTSSLFWACDPDIDV